MLDVWLDKNLNCAFYKNIQLPLSQKRNSSSSYLLLSSVIQKPQKMQTQLCCFTNPPLKQDLKTQRLRHLLKAAQTLWGSLYWTRSSNSHLLCSQTVQYTSTVAGTRATQDCLTSNWSSPCLQTVPMGSYSLSLYLQKSVWTCFLCAPPRLNKPGSLCLSLSAPALTTSMASARLC